jgi:hypothetical protein
MQVLFIGAALLALGFYRHHTAAACRDARAKQWDLR